MSNVLEPAIITYGRTNVNAYPEEEYRASMRRAFIDGRADFVTLDSSPHGQKFLSACAAYAIDLGFLRCDRIETGEQEEIASFRLTDLGRDWAAGRYHPVIDGICQECG